ncbi:MAG: methylmalonyl-CoA epimerase [Desulfobacca sp.]|nr:methylmalonyl-CoA epimerase [Desulfobacca sp.]
MKPNKIHHIAIAVHNIKEAAKLYENVLGLTLSGVEEIPSQKTKVGFVTCGGINIELIEPTGPDSTLAKFLENRGQGLHHVCFEVDDMEAALKACLDEKITLIDKKPGLGSQHTKIAFIQPKSMGNVLVEFCELPKT